MVIAKSWYATAFEHSSNVTVTFNPYDIDPMPSVGGAIQVAGQYDIPGTPAKLTQIYYEMSHLVGNSGYFQPVPASWWDRGTWENGGALDPILLQLNLDQFEPDGYDNTAVMSMTSWDGTSQETRSSETGGSSSTLVNVLNKVATNSAVSFTANADITTGQFAGQWWPQLQGVLADILKQISGGLGVNVYYTPGTTSFAGVLGAAKPIVRLVNAMHSKRKVVRPQFVPEVQMYCYNTSRAVNKVVYASPDIIQVNSGEDQDIVAQLPGTPMFNTVLQPSPVGAIPSIPYTGPSSIYCVYDADGFEAHNVWTAYGGKITVAPGDAPDEMKIHIRAPYDAGNPTAQYSIAELDNPALYIVAGDGVLFNKQLFAFQTGAVVTSTQFRPADYVDPLLDNSLIVSPNIMFNRAVAFIAQQSAPNLTIDDVSFDNAVLRDPTTGVESIVDPATLASAKFKAHGAYYRFTRLSWAQPGFYSGSAEECTTVADFDQEFGTMTLLQYQTYLAGEYPDAAAPSFGAATGQFPTGTPMDSGLQALVAPSLEQWAMEPLRTAT